MRPRRCRLLIPMQAHTLPTALPGADLSPTLKQPRSFVMPTQPNQTDQDRADGQSQKSSGGKQDQSQPGTGNQRLPADDRSSPQSPNDRSEDADKSRDLEGNKPQRGQKEKIDTEKDLEKPARMNDED